MRIGILALVLCAGASFASAKKPFERGSNRLSVGASGNQNGVGMAVGVGHFIANGLELGLDTAFWFGENGNQLHLMPGLRYVFYKPKRFKPYVGVFYHRSVYSSEVQPNKNSIGARAGGFFRGGRHFFGVGIAYEKYLSCTGKDCEEFYPEIHFAFHL